MSRPLMIELLVGVPVSFLLFIGCVGTPDSCNPEVRYPKMVFKFR